jgi:hypothetical protein
MAKTQRGRPNLPEAEKRKPAFLVKLSDVELDLIKRAVPRRVSTWARETLLRAAKRLVK